MSTELAQSKVKWLVIGYIGFLVVMFLAVCATEGIKAYKYKSCLELTKDVEKCK